MANHAEGLAANDFGTPPKAAQKPIVIKTKRTHERIKANTPHLSRRKRKSTELGDPEQTESFFDIDSTRVETMLQ